MPPNRRRNILGNANRRPPPGPNRRPFPRPSPGWPPTGPPPAAARTHRPGARAAPTFYAVARHPGYSSGSSRRRRAPHPGLAYAASSRHSRSGRLMQEKIGVSRSV